MPRTGAPTIDEESVIRLRNALLRTARRLRTGGDPEGLSASQSSVLATLVREGPLRAGDLADAEALNPTMLSRILAHLEGRGLAVRTPDPDDGVPYRFQIASRRLALSRRSPQSVQRAALGCQRLK